MALRRRVTSGCGGKVEGKEGGDRGKGEDDRGKGGRAIEGNVGGRWKGGR